MRKMREIILCEILVSPCLGDHCQTSDMSYQPGYQPWTEPLGEIQSCFTHFNLKAPTNIP